VRSLVFQRCPARCMPPCRRARSGIVGQELPGPTASRNSQLGAQPGSWAPLTSLLRVVTFHAAHGLLVGVCHSTPITITPLPRAAVLHAACFYASYCQ